LAFLAKTTASFLKYVIKTLLFEKNANFFRKKLAKIAEKCDHDIDPWSTRKSVSVSPGLDVAGEIRQRAGQLDKVAVVPEIKKNRNIRGR
jgi:hypothetical protein